MSDFRLWDDRCEVCNIVEGPPDVILTDRLMDGLWKTVCESCAMHHDETAPVGIHYETYKAVEPVWRTA